MEYADVYLYLNFNALTASTLIYIWVLSVKCALIEKKMLQVMRLMKLPSLVDYVLCNST